MTDDRLTTYRTRVPAEWVDYNRHLNIGYYMIAFDKATDGFADRLGIGAAYVKATGNSYYVVETHLCFEREVLENAPIRVETLLLAADDKRIHFCHCLYEETGNFLAATSEMLGLHVNLSTRRAAPFPPEQARAIAALADQQRTLTRPAQLGRTVALKRKA
ncbi:MAG: thioesterase family protein [Proteobacteria bacterium]|nr:thioesterase family protein [Pseudomonadota bacterium]